MYKHIYEFKTEKGIIRGEGDPSSDKNEHIIGTTEEISYNPKNPKQFNIGGKKESNTLLIIGIISLIISIICINKIIKIYKGACNYIDLNIKKRIFKILFLILKDFLIKSRII